MCKHVCHLVCNEQSLCLVETSPCASVLPATQRPKGITVAQKKVGGTDRAANEMIQKTMSIWTTQKPMTFH